MNNYQELIKLHEGFRHYVYLDSLGNKTCGWGHCFSGPEDKPVLGRIFSNAECADFFDEDMQVVERDYVWLEKKFALQALGPVRRAVLKNMLFNLGLRRLLGFRKMLAALQNSIWSRAGEEMFDSKWATQVKSRARMLARMMRTGQWPLL